MRTAGFRPNTVVLTTLLKGHCAAGDVASARTLLESFATASPPVRPDSRTLNTFLRGCVRTGDLAAARWAFGKLEEWKLAGAVSSTAFVAYGRLLSQGLHLGELRRSLKEHAERGSAAFTHRPLRTSNPCMFWERGLCERGRRCTFYHDPAIPQSNAHELEADHRDTELELTVSPPPQPPPQPQP